MTVEKIERQERVLGVCVCTQVSSTFFCLRDYCLRSCEGSTKMAPHEC
jgi:hypothetical protein